MKIRDTQQVPGVHIMATLSGLTYVIEVSKKNRILVRLAPSGSTTMDYGEWWETHDVLAYGFTVDEAAALALEVRERRCN